MAELVDALDSKSSSARSVGSSPTRATRFETTQSGGFFVVGRRTGRFGTPVAANKLCAVRGIRSERGPLCQCGINGNIQSDQGHQI